MSSKNDRKYSIVAQSCVDTTKLLRGEQLTGNQFSRKPFSPKYWEFATFRNIII